MKTTTYICDKCQKTVEKEELVPLEICGAIITELNPYIHTTVISKDICKTCLTEKGLLIKYNHETYKEDRKHNEKTLEDKMLEILEELGVAFLE